jgi:hypothetical protein
MLKIAILVLFSTIFITGCASDSERAAAAERDARRRIDVYGAACEQMGFKKDTDAWRFCVVTYSPTGHHH